MRAGGDPGKVFIKIHVMNKVLPLFLIILAAQAFAQQLPYGQSDVIQGVVWDQGSKIQFGQGSDQWPMTWAFDDQLYASWGDGMGWVLQANEEKKSMGVTRIAGHPPVLSATDTWGVGPGSSFGKPDALVAFDKKIFMFWTNGDSRFDHDSYSAVSLDSGKTWKLGQERIFRYAPAGFRVRGICQFGKDYQGAPDNFLYIYFAFNRHPDIYLAKVEKENIFNGGAYQWFEYIKEDGTASWTPDFQKKSVVLHDNNAYLWHLGICYNPGLKRYLLTKPHFAAHDNRHDVLADISGLGIFDAPAPWGPWTTVFYQNDFLDKYVKFNYLIPVKFLSKDGKKFWLCWSGWPEYDNVNFIKGEFKVAARRMD